MCGFLESWNEKEKAVNVDVPHCVAEFNLSQDKYYIPIIEAITNAIHSIEDAKKGKGKGKGKVEITIERDASQQQIKDEKKQNYVRHLPIRSFVITDNGVGFTRANYDSFSTVFSSYKQTRSAKGLGRFSWLKAFAKVHVHSIFMEDGRYYERSFDFMNTPEGVENDSLQERDKAECGTKISLIDFKDPYREKCKKSAESIGNLIVESCLEYFIIASCPNIFLIDVHEEYQRNLTTAMDSVKVKTDAFSVGGEKFSIKHIQVPHTPSRTHQLHYCAGNVCVQSEKLNLIDLDKAIHDEESGQSFFYAGYISGDHLTKNVKSCRTAFNIPEKNGGDLLGVKVGFDDLRQCSKEKASEYLDGYLKKARDEKRIKIQNYIRNEAPQYRCLYKARPNFIDSIPANVSENNYEDELLKQYHEADRETRAKLKEIESKSIDAAEDLELADIHKDILSKYTTLNWYSLTQYVTYRKAVLLLLERWMGRQEDGKFKLEEAIHDAIVPIRCTSDEMDYDDHNLWIIDEKLSFHHYLMSDKKIKSGTELQSDSDLRTDVTIFNKYFAFCDSKDDHPYSSIVIIEFKRPMREGYKEDPILEMNRRVRAIRDGSARDDQDRLIPVGVGTQIYCYLICHITDALRERLDSHAFTPMPDEGGFFRYNTNPSMRCCEEVISYEKLLSDAKKRNKVLFEKLNQIPMDPFLVQDDEIA